MIPMPLLEKLVSQSLITSIEVIQITIYSSKPNKKW